MTRRTYKFTLTTSVQLDDKTLREVIRMMQEHINVMYHKMEREDIRIILQHQLEIVETDTIDVEETQSMSPIISFTARDLLRGKVVEPAWYLMQIENIGEAPSKDGGSINYPVEGTIIKNADSGSEEFKGTPIDWNFNSKAIGFARGFLESFRVELKEGARYDLASAVGKQLEVFVENDTWQGRLVNRVNHKYRPVRS